MRQAVIVLAVLTSIGATAAVSADDPEKPSAELRVLEDLIGTWDEEMTNKPTDWTPKAETITSVTKRSWSLGGKFIRGEGAWLPAKIEFLHLLSYDPESKAYRTWYFDAAGMMPRTSAKGAWDEKNRTLTFRDTDEAGNKVVSIQKFLDKDHNSWTLVTTNPDGKILLDLTGKCTRRK